MDIKYNNLLSDEELVLMNPKSKNIFYIDQKDIFRSICTHRSANGKSDTLIYDNDTKEATCSICGAILNSNIYTEEDIKNKIDEMINIIQQLKLYMVDFKNDEEKESARDFLKIIAYIEKIPEIRDEFIKRFDRLEAEALQWCVYSGYEYPDVIHE